MSVRTVLSSALLVLGLCSAATAQEAEQLQADLHEAGFMFEVPDGWEAVSEGIEGGGRALVLIPAGATPGTYTSLIALWQTDSDSLEDLGEAWADEIDRIVEDEGLDSLEWGPASEEHNGLRGRTGMAEQVEVDDRRFTAIVFLLEAPAHGTTALALILFAADGPPDEELAAAQACIEGMSQR
jgi:hypothetical protein